MPAAKPVGSTVMVRVAGVVPEVGVTESQVPPDTDTVNGTLPRFEVSEAVTGGGDAVPMV